MIKRCYCGKYSVGQLCIMAVFVAVGLVLQLIESSFTAFSVPGAKIGLANVVSVINLFVFGGANTLLIAVLRAAAGSLLSGGVTAAAYSIAGAAASATVMWLCRRKFFPPLGIVGISIFGAVAHNIAQLFVAAITVQSVYVFSYLSAALIFALCGGIATGYTAAYAFERIDKLRKYIMK